MSSVSIRRREAKNGARFQVRYRLGGRGYPIVHGGSFSTMREARLRRDLIAGELAAGRNPRLLLAAMTAAPAPVLTLSPLARPLPRVADRRRREHDRELPHRAEEGLRRPSATATRRRSRADEVAAWVASSPQTHKPGTVQLYLIALRLLLDFVGARPERRP